MPKAKTHKGARKRVRVSKKGRVKFRHSFTSHLLSSRSSNRLRKLRRRGVACRADEKRILELLGKTRP
ncbi:MAG: 50S ribosomal protein L35 [Planctomycetes bacterium]|nr:50S ribosomal protein L35 [Planctomycetota bacterium]